MAQATKKIGSVIKYYCPACGDSKEEGLMLWDKVPSPENPEGKVRCCLSCSGVASIVMGWRVPEGMPMTGMMT